MSGSICKVQMQNICEDKSRDEDKENPLIGFFNIFLDYISGRKSSKVNYLYLKDMDDHLLRDVGLDRGALHQTIRRRDRR